MPNSKTVLLARTNVDSVTANSYSWAENVKQCFEKEGWNVIDIYKDQIEKKDIEEIFRQNYGNLFLFYGHGEEDRLKGPDSTPLIDLDNIQLLENRKVYTVACFTARKLGEKAGAIAEFYLGYKEEVVTYPKFSDSVGNCVNKGILVMLQNPNYNLDQAYEETWKEYTYWIDYYGELGKKGDTIDDLWIRNFAIELRFIRDSLKIFGNTQAKLIG